MSLSYELNGALKEDIGAIIGAGAQGLKKVIKESWDMYDRVQKTKNRVEEEKPKLRILLKDHEEGVTAEILSESDSVWEPVGTPAEDLEANLAPPHLPSLGGSVAAWGGEVTPGGLAAGYVVAGAASLPGDVELERCVVWDGEKLPAGFRGSDGVYAGGAFHACPGAIRKPESSRGGSVIGSAQ